MNGAVYCRNFRGRLRSQRGTMAFSAVEDASSAARCREVRPSITVPEERGERQAEGTTEVAFYRKRTEAMLRRYLRVSLQVGRMPSCLPREMLRARRTRQAGCSFEDLMIFVYDIEKCIGKLDRLAVEVLTKVALQEYSQREAAHLMGLSQATLGRSYERALDVLSDIFLSHDLLSR